MLAKTPESFKNVSLLFDEYILPKLQTVSNHSTKNRAPLLFFGLISGGRSLGFVVTRDEQIRKSRDREKPVFDERSYKSDLTITPKILGFDTV